MLNSWAIVLLGAAGALAACVGDQPSSDVTNVPDAGAAADGDTSDGATTTTTPEAAAGSCAGQPFAAPVAVGLGGLPDAGPPTLILQVRVVGATAYFARTDTGSAPAFLFKADYAAGDPPSLSGGASILAQEAESDLAPAVAADGSYMYFTHGEPGGRHIWVATAGGIGFINGAAAGDLLNGANTEDADPWLAGAPSRRLYFGRGQQSTTAMRIVYADVTPSAGDVPKLGTVVSFSPPCPVASTDNCGRPVVTPDESMLLFASWSAGAASVDYAMHEVLLTKDATGAVTASATVIDHPELGARSVSWLSADGCEALLNGGGNFYATRTPK